MAILHAVDDDLMHPLNWKDFAITETDKALYRAQIDRIEKDKEFIEEPYEIPLDSVDYNFYRTYADSLQQFRVLFKHVSARKNARLEHYNQLGFHYYPQPVRRKTGDQKRSVHAQRLVDALDDCVRRTHL